MDISYEEMVLVERIGKSLRMTNEQVGKTSYVKLMRMLVNKIEDLEIINGAHREMVEDVKNLIKDLEG